MQVTYMNGAGNDFMVLDARGKQLDLSALARTLCEKTGADGFMAVDVSKTADFRLHFYNADGSRGEMCGNGARCICRYAYDHGIAGPEMTVQTDAGPVLGWRLSEDTYRVRLNNPSVLDLHRKGDIAYVELGSPGVPHAVAEYPGDLWRDREKLREQMKALRFDPAFPKGANVNFYQWLGENEVRLLTYERGVEDFTLACGTGTGSVAAVLHAQGRLTAPLKAHNPGGTLTITLTAAPQTLDLEGPTQVVREYDMCI
ncbi:MAG: diaminopimelate epimerase [Eubacteriales bacterium]|nr:diaminopimelate epimerase [Eubacteriales bacterium]